MSALGFETVTVTLGERAALSGVSFSAEAGGLIALVGPNGAGKTTLLRAACGLAPLAEGRVTLNGAAVRSLAPRTRAKAIAYLPQERDTAWPMTGRRLAALGRFPYAGPLRRMSEADRAAVNRALAAADADLFADRPVDHLSGGERARILLARALAVEAPVLLADEPTAALDPAHQLTVMQALKDAAAGGALVVAALHDLGLAQRFADRVIVLDQGRVVSDGAPGEALSDAVLRDVFAVRREGETLVLASNASPPRGGEA